MPPPDVRGKDFKKTLDKDDARRNREETTISLRKDKRAEQLQKKRFGMAGASGVMPASPETPGMHVSTGSQAWQEAQPLALGTASTTPQPHARPCPRVRPSRHSGPLTLACSVLAFRDRPVDCLDLQSRA
jgi:hypothetical protein